MKVFEVLYDAEAPGPAGDGTHVARFLARQQAEKFAALNTHYGQPTSVAEVDAPHRICERWVVMSLHEPSRAFTSRQVSASGR